MIKGKLYNKEVDEWSERLALGAIIYDEYTSIIKKDYKVIFYVVDEWSARLARKRAFRRLPAPLYLYNKKKQSYNLCLMLLCSDSMIKPDIRKILNNN